MENEERKKLKYKDGDLYISIYSYDVNGRMAILSEYSDGELYGDITVNLPELFVPDIQYGFINSFVKNSGMEKELINKKIIKYVIGTLPYNYGEYDLVEFNLEELKKYDPAGLKKYLKSNSIELEKNIDV